MKFKDRLPKRVRTALEILGVEATKKDVITELMPGGRLYMENSKSGSVYGWEDLYWKNEGRMLRIGWKSFVSACQVCGITVFEQFSGHQLKCREKYKSRKQKQYCSGTCNCGTEVKIPDRAYVGPTVNCPSRGIVMVLQPNIQKYRLAPKECGELIASHNGVSK